MMIVILLFCGIKINAIIGFIIYLISAFLLAIVIMKEEVISLLKQLINIGARRIKNV